MEYDCVILPEYFKGNSFCNTKGGEFGCPIDRALFAAKVPMKDPCYCSDKVANQLWDVESKVMNMFFNYKADITPIHFKIIL